MNAVIEKWIRTCQECGNKQSDKAPDFNTDPSNTYMNRACRKCKSEALDYGSYKQFDSAGNELDWDGE